VDPSNTSVAVVASRRRVRGRSKNSANGRSLKHDRCCAEGRHLAGSFAVLPAVVGAIARSKTGPNSIIHAWGDRRRGWDRKAHESEARYADETSGQNYQPGRGR